MQIELIWLKLNQSMDAARQQHTWRALLSEHLEGLIIVSNFTGLIILIIISQFLQNNYF